MSGVKCCASGVALLDRRMTTLAWFVFPRASYSLQVWCYLSWRLMPGKPGDSLRCLLALPC